MRAAGVPAAEIAGLAMVFEFGAVAQRVSDGEFKHGAPQLLRKLTQATRAVEGIPVWTSYVRLGLTAKGDVGTLELHWPHLSPPVIKEAGLLKAMVKRGFEPPQLPGARLESLAAGVIHSPAIGFFMDLAAVIRATYVGDDPAIGRKPTLYLDRHGEPVAMPRDIALLKPEPRDPRPRPKAPHPQPRDKGSPGRTLFAAASIRPRSGPVLAAAHLAPGHDRARRQTSRASAWLCSQSQPRRSRPPDVRGAGRR